MVLYPLQNHGQGLGPLIDCTYIASHEATCAWRRQSCFEHNNVLRFVNNVTNYSLLNINFGEDLVLNTC